MIGCGSASLGNITTTSGSSTIGTTGQTRGCVENSSSTSSATTGKARNATMAMVTMEQEKLTMVDWITSTISPL